MQEGKEGSLCELANFTKGHGVYNGLQGLATLQGFTRKGLQSRSATASLLIKSNKCMKENISGKMFSLLLSPHRFP